MERYILHTVGISDNERTDVLLSMFNRKCNCKLFVSSKYENGITWISNHRMYHDSRTYQHII